MFRPWIGRNRLKLADSDLFSRFCLVFKLCFKELCIKKIWDFAKKSKASSFQRSVQRLPKPPITSNAVGSLTGGPHETTRLSQPLSAVINGVREIHKDILFKAQGTFSSGQFANFQLVPGLRNLGSLY